MWFSSYATPWGTTSTMCCQVRMSAKLFSQVEITMKASSIMGNKNRNSYIRIQLRYPSKLTKNFTLWILQIPMNKTLWFPIKLCNCWWENARQKHQMNAERTLIYFTAFYINMIHIPCPQFFTNSVRLSSPAYICKNVEELDVTRTDFVFFCLLDAKKAPPIVMLWLDYMFERVGYALVEFGAHLKQKDGSGVMPSTLTNKI